MTTPSYDHLGTNVGSISNSGSLSMPADAPKTLAEALQRASKKHSGQGLTYINLDSYEYSQSYEDLLEDAQLILGGLRKLGLKPQDKVIFQLERNQDFIIAFWGCILGGFVPVPVPMVMNYEEASNATNKLHYIWQLLEQPPILTDIKSVSKIQSLSKLFQSDQFEAVAIDELRECELDKNLYVSQPEDLALLMLTSGSTSMPKAVTLSHRNLLSMSAGTIVMNAFTCEDVTLNWMPMDHVGALVFLSIMAVDLGCSQVHVPTEYILQNPLNWLDLITRHQGTISWAPNFAFTLLCDRAEEISRGDWDLSSMRFLVNAGEPVVAKTARNFLKLLGQHGLPSTALHPAFGMCETCSGITWSNSFSLESTSDDDTFVSVGDPIPGASVRIVDENQKVVEEGRIGQLQLQGNSVTTGYYRNEEENQEAFTKDGWFNTGDLGFLKDRCLTITGRQKDVIIVNGINYYSHEIEAIVEELEDIEVSYTAACPIWDESGSTDRLAIFFNTAKTIDNGLVELIKSIRTHVVKSIGINPNYLIPLEKTVIPKTAIGKIQRKQLKQRFEKGEFKGIVAQISTALAKLKAENFVSGNGLERDVAEIWQEVLQIPSVGIHDNFFELGGHSVMLVQVHSKLQALFDTNLSVVDLFKYPTIHTIVEYLTQKDSSQGASQDGIARAKLRKSAVTSQDVAIIGMACRFPGAENISQFWQNLCDGVESISFFSKEEVLAEGIHKQRLENPNYVKAAPILEKIEEFDANFFGYSAREAMIIDPQQRLFLECAWEALEDAGYDAHTYKGAIGMYAGAGMNTYFMHNVFPNRDRFNAEDGPQVMTLDSMGGFQIQIANDKDYLPTRVSYKLNLKGPSLNIQTACSTSLVAIHTAYQSVVNGECDMALAGGVSVNVPQKAGHLYEDGMIVSPDGHCRAFDAKAQGTIFGNGSGIVLLKRLNRAIADGDHIYCAIKGSAINNDGAMKVGYSATSQEGQATSLAESIALAGINADTITYFETHGTGTSMGDPIEVAAMSEAFHSTTSKLGFCAIGSVKTNVGHLQIASGVAGFIKTALALKNKKIPPSLHFDQPNPLIDFANSPFYVNTELQDWKTDGIPRRAGVKSLGIGGTNACLILEEPPIQVKTGLGEESKNEDYRERSLHLLTLSAKMSKALEELVSRYQHHLESNPELEMADICYTANIGRSNFDYRLAIIASDTQVLTDKLVKISSKEEVNGVFTGKLSSDSKSSLIAFLFTGQGSQYINMGRELYATQSVFRRTLEQCEQILQPYLNTSILDIIYPEDSQKLNNSVIDQTACTQVALFAIEYALYKLWESWGIKPSVVMGHSVGEYVAATVAGVFSLEDGLKLIAHRGRLMQQLPHGGEMLAVMASQELVNQVIAPYTEKLAIAAINGPQSIVISGESEAITTVKEILEAQEIKTKQLQVSNGFHSHLMEPMLAEFEAIASQISYDQPTIPVISNITGVRADERIATASYWVNHIRQSVKFAQSIETLHQEGCEIFLEIGPKPTLLGMGRQCLPEDVGTWLPSLRPGQSNWQQMLQSLAQLYVRGVEVDWLGFDKDYSRSKVVLPTYAFQRQRYWVESPKTKHQVGRDLFTHKHSTQIVNLLNQGDTQQLAQRLTKTGKLSPSQVQVLPELLDLLIEQHQQQLKASIIEDWFYKVEWKLKSRHIKSTPKTLQNRRQSSHWIIFADSNGVGDFLATRLQEQGHRCTLVYGGEAYKKLENNIWRLNPCQVDDFERFLKEVLTTSQLPLKGIIHLWSFEAVSSEQLTLPALEEAQRWGCGSVLNLLQALLKHTGEVSSRLWLITRGSQPVKPQTDYFEFASAPLLGLAKVIALEHPQLWGGILDLNSEATLDELDMLLAEIEDPQGENQLAFRGGQRYVARLVKQPLVTYDTISLRSDSTYLIAGGLGALGLLVAEWMVRRGARHLVLVGRHGVSNKTQDIISQLEQIGSEVIVVRGNISHREDVVRILERVDSSLPPLRGVINAAGVLDDGILSKLSWERFAGVMAPKVQGTWNLHTLTQNYPLEFFVCFSSMAALLGSPGQGNYAAANAFMDALIHHRRAIGLPGLTINWGPWGTAGMAAELDSDYQNRWAVMGMDLITPEQGLQILEQLLGEPLGQVGVLAIDWPVFQQQSSFSSQRPFLAELIGEVTSQKQVNSIQKQHSELLERLKTAAYLEECQDILMTHLQEEVGKILGRDSSQLPLELDLGFVEMGMDSLTVVELNNRLQKQLGISLSITLPLEYPTIKKLTKYLSEKVINWEFEVEVDSNLSNIENRQAVSERSNLENLSDEQAEALLMSKLGKMGY